MVVVFLADGFEEVEALAPVDILRRGGVEVKTVGVTGKTVVGSHQIPVVSDCTLDGLNISNLEGVILPGGMPGTKNLEKDKSVLNLLHHAFDQNLLVGAICAAPSVLGHEGILQGKRATCFPGFEKDLLGAEFCGQPVVRDGNVITARGAGVATQFGLELLSYFKGKEVADKMGKTMQCVD